MGALGCSFEALRRQLAHQMPTGRCDEDSVRRQWWAALATLQEDFLLPLGAAGCLVGLSPAGPL